MKKFIRQSSRFRLIDAMYCVNQGIHRKVTASRNNKNLITYCCGLFLVLMTACSPGEPRIGTPSTLAENAPKDEPVKSHDFKQHDSLIAPYKAEALRTLPESKQRYLKGLTPGEVFFVKTRICDSNGNCEDIFVEVRKWEKDKIEGLIANELDIVEEYEFGQIINVNEEDVIDWTISKPDGTEEGNFVGKFMDTW